MCGVSPCSTEKIAMKTLLPLLIYQDGTLAEASVEQLHRLNRALRS